MGSAMQLAARMLAAPFSCAGFFINGLESLHLTFGKIYQHNQSLLLVRFVAGGRWASWEAAMAYLSSGPVPVVDVTLLLCAAQEVYTCRILFVVDLGKRPKTWATRSGLAKHRVDLPNDHGRIVHRTADSR